MNHCITVTHEADELFPVEMENFKDHFLLVKIYSNEYASLRFSSLLSIKLFALSLIQEATYGTMSHKLLDSVVYNDGYLGFIEGVRVMPNSSRFFINYDNEEDEGVLPDCIQISDNMKYSDFKLMGIKELNVEITSSHNYVDLVFESRSAMYLFGVSILHQCLCLGKHIIDLDLMPIKINMGGKKLSISYGEITYAEIEHSINKYLPQLNTGKDAS